MKSKRKALLLLMCAVLLVASSVFGTIAYLTDSEAVANTFTVGQIHITMDEAAVNTAGQKLNNEGGVYKDGDILADRVTANSYHLLPGQTYTKDPIIRVDAGSENSYIFIKVDNNGVEAIEETANDYKNVAAQILENGWTWWKNEGNVHYFYREYTKDQAILELKVFEQFKVGDSVTNEQLEKFYEAAAKNGNEAKAVIITAYAVQAAGFDNAEAAWNATFGANP